MNKLALLILLTGAAQALYEDGSCLTCCNCGTLTASNPYVYINSSLRLTCQINESSLSPDVTSSNLFFAFGRQRLSDTYLYIIDNRTVMFEKVMENIEEAGTYSCEIDDLTDGNRFVGKQAVQLEYPPAKVTDFSCIIFDWEKNMTCTWKLGPYVHMNNIDVTLIASNELSGHHYCQDLLNKTMCIWNGNVFRLNVQTWQFIVIVKNIITGDEANTLITEHPEKYVLPDRVQSFTASNRGSRCMFLEWNYTSAADFKEKKCKISFQSKWNSTQEVFVYDSTKETEVCDLVPYTNYNFSIQLRPMLSSKECGSSSEPVYLHHTTSQDVPGTPPPIVMGSYETTSCKGSMDRRRKVVIHWKFVPEMYRNGEITGYSVSYANPEGDNMTSKINGNTPLQEVEVSCNRRTLIQLQSINSEGSSAEKSTIVIPSATEVEPPSNVTVEVVTDMELDLASYFVSWDSMRQPFIQNFTVFWCDGRCITNEIEWKTVPGYTTSLTKTIPSSQISDMGYTRFGVSSDAQSISSGFIWETCQYSRDGEPMSPQNVQITDVKDGIMVVWSTPECSIGINKAYPASYVVSWCKMKQNQQKCLSDDVNEAYVNLENSYFIQNVEMGEEYGVRLQSVSRKQVRSPMTAMKVGKPQSSSLTEEEIIPIALGCLFVFVLIICGAVLIIRKAYRYYVSVMDPIEIKMPDMNKKTMNGVIYDTCNKNEDIGLSLKTEMLHLIEKDNNKKMEIMGEVDNSAKDNSGNPEESCVESQETVQGVSSTAEIPSGYAKATMNSSANQSQEPIGSSSCQDSSTNLYHKFCEVLNSDFSGYPPLPDSGEQDEERSDQGGLVSRDETADQNGESSGEGDNGDSFSRSLESVPYTGSSAGLSDDENANTSQASINNLDHSVRVSRESIATCSDESPQSSTGSFTDTHPESSAGIVTDASRSSSLPRSISQSDSVISRSKTPEDVSSPSSDSSGPPVDSSGISDSGDYDTSMCSDYMSFTCVNVMSSSSSQFPYNTNSDFNSDTSKI